MWKMRNCDKMMRREARHPVDLGLDESGVLAWILNK
jgi:hypothetical protein